MKKSAKLLDKESFCHSSALVDIPEEITMQQMAKAIDLLRQEYLEHKNALSSIFSKNSERISLQEIAKKYDCHWKTFHKIVNEEQVSIKTLKKICVKILEKQNETNR